MGNLTDLPTQLADLLKIQTDGLGEEPPVPPAAQISPMD
jgi:hypothetical protein